MVTLGLPFQSKSTRLGSAYMRIPTNKIVQLIFILLPILVFLYVAGLFDPTNAFRCWSVGHSVLSALDNAISVRVVEHSSRFDTLIFQNDPNYTDMIYSTVTLTPKQIEDLRSALPLSLRFDGGILKCIFEEHQRIEITQKDGTVKSLHLCFHCGQLYMGELGKDDEYYGTMPPSWHSSLSRFISSIGLHPDGPWDKNPDAASP
jgi:hypothetical protein